MAPQASGQREKLKCLPRNIKRQAEAIETDGTKEITKVPEAMDKAKLANKVRQEQHSG